MAGRAGPQAGLGCGQAEGHRGVHVGEERHRGRGRRRRRRPREASQGRRAKQVGFQQREGMRGRRDERQRFQRAGQVGQAGGRVCARGCGDGFFLRVPDDGGRLGQPLGGWFGCGFLLLGGGGRQGGLLGLLGRRCGAAGAVGADVEVLEEGAVGAEAQQAVLTSVGPQAVSGLGQSVLPWSLWGTQTPPPDLGSAPLQWGTGWPQMRHRMGLCVHGMDP